MIMLQSKINDINKDFNLNKDDLKIKLINLSNLQKTINEQKIYLNKVNEELILAEESKHIVNNVVMGVRDESLRFIEQVVNMALQDVFTDSKKELVLELKAEAAGKVAITPFIKEDGEMFTLDYKGGGLKSLVSIAIIVCIRKIVGIKLPLFLDETLGSLNDITNNLYIKQAFSFLKIIAEQLDTQIFIITSRANFEMAQEMANEVIIVSKKDGQSNYEIIK